MMASVSQQYVLASKARSKLMKCANAGRNKDFDLRVLVGHANMLDRLMENIDKFNGKDCAAAGSYGVEYISSDEDSDEENRALSSDSSSDEADSEDDTDDDTDDEADRAYAQPLLIGPGRSTSVVTVTIDRRIDNDEYDSESESESESDYEDQWFDLSRMPLSGPIAV